MQSRKRILLVLIPLCLFVAAYCLIAGLASGGWHQNREGEPSYSAPVHHSAEFYLGLRWSVMIVGGVVGFTSYCWKRRALSAVFGTVAVLFNPIVPIHLPKQTWQVIDLLVFWVFLIGPGYLWPKSNERDSHATTA